MTVKTLLNRTVESFRSHGYEPHWINYSAYHGELPTKTFDIHETHRMNHSEEENVTVTIEITKWNSENTGRVIAKIKVPKDASDKVLANRVEQAIKVYEEA